MKVQVEQLRAIVNLLMDDLAEKTDGVVDLPQSYYWSIPPDALYDPYAEPTELTMGDLNFDWDDLLKELGRDEDDRIGYALVWASEIFRAIGHTVV